MNIKWTILFKIIYFQLRILISKNKYLYQSLTKTHVANNNIDKQLTNRILGLTSKISEKLPWNPSCLCKVLTVRSMLFRYNINSKVHLSVKRNNSKIEPHAWMEIQDIRFLYPTDFKYYTTIKTIN